MFVVVTVKAWKTIMTSATIGEIETRKTRLKLIWLVGDTIVFRDMRYMQADAREFYEAFNIASGGRLLGGAHRAGADCTTVFGE